jgi:peptidoglycan hydrolase CwlO-like protein
VPPGKGLRAGVVLVLVSWCTATVALTAAAPPSGADQLSGLQTQAATLSQKMLLEQLQIGAFSSQYQFAVEQVAQDAAAISAMQTKIDANRNQIDQVKSAAQNEAVWAYIHAGSTASDSVTSLFSSGATSQALAREYAQVVGGDLQTTLAALHTAQNVLAADEAELQHAQAQAQALQAQAASLLAGAQQARQLLSSQQAQVNGELAVAVSQAQAAQVQTATAAVHSATTSAPRAPTSSAPKPAPVSTTPDPPLPPYLQCVVQRESGGNYAVVSPDGIYMGAFQFSQSTWNVAAQLASRPDLIGVAPNDAAKADQDTLAIALYSADGTQPWLGGCGA